LIAFAHRRWSFSSFLLRWREPGSNLPWANIPCAEWDIILGRLVHDSKSCVSAKKDVKDSGCACFLSRPEMGVDGQVVVYLHVVCMSCNVALECRIHREFSPHPPCSASSWPGICWSFSGFCSNGQQSNLHNAYDRMAGKMVSNALGNWVWKTTRQLSMTNHLFLILYIQNLASKLMAVHRSMCGSWCLDHH
jgi:hypothetical protein